MSEDQTAAEYAKEWRESVRLGMTENGKKLDQVLAEISKIRTEFAPVDKHDELADRVRSLEDNQARFMGGIVILNIIGGLALTIIMKIWK